jgi:chemotaxis protein methyltransferase CheR
MTTAAQGTNPPAGLFKIAEPVDPVFRQIRNLVYRISGIYNSEGNFYLLVGGSTKRMKAPNLRSPRDYLNYLTTHPSRDSELRHLPNEVTIGDTCLFRSPSQIDALRKVILPESAAEKPKQSAKKLRIWSAGCSTGKEPYTVAMIVVSRNESPPAGLEPILLGGNFLPSRVVVF